MKTIIIISLCICTILLIYFGTKQKLTSTKLAEYLTIYGIFIGILIYLDLSPQSVQVTKSLSLKISSLEAYETFSRKGRSRLAWRNYPYLSFSSYIINSGDIPVTDAGLKFKFENNPPGLKLNNYLKAYVLKGIDTKIKYPNKFDWMSDSSGNCNILNLENDNYYQIILPPILTNESLSLIVAYDLKSYDDSMRFHLDTLLKGYVEVSVYNRGEIIPNWVPDRSEIKNYKTTRLKEDEVFDTKKKWFLLFRSGFGF